MYIRLNGIKIFYEVAGSGYPLIMVHGNGEEHGIFKKSAEKLSRYFTCYMLDTRGHGKSEPVAEYHYEDMAQDVLNFADALELNQPDFYGFSDGGIVGLLCAMKRPYFFRNLMVSGANLNPDGVRPQIKLMMQLSYAFHKDPKVRLMLEEPSIEPRSLKNIRGRVLVTAGERDLIRAAHTRLIARMIPGAKLLLLPGEGHGSYIVNSDKIADIITDFACGLD